ncbi:MAG: hypothetical protein PHF84_06265 [bacterium]|nr:hypothetical protein [bacterium]
MKKILFVLLIYLTSLSGLQAQETGETEPAPVPETEVQASGSSLQWAGYFQADTRFYRKYNHAISWQEYRLDLQAEAKPSDKTHFYSELWVRSLGFPSANTTADLSRKENVSPGDLDLREAYFDVYGFFLDNLDIRVGRQRIAWGTGDKINPTDNLNSLDLEDIYDFGRHFGSDSVKLTYYFTGLTFSAVFIPVFKPALLPQGDWLTALFPSADMPAGLSLNSASDKLIMPENTLKQSSSGGIKISKNILGYDISASYVYTRDSLPVLKKVILTPVNVLNPYVVNVSSELVYPVIEVVGLDMSGSVADVGVWAEAAMFIPRKVTQVSELPLPYPYGFHQESVSLDSHNYVKYLIGMDYTFKNGLYYNLQYLHGFFHERGESNLQNYFLLRLEYKFLDDKVKIAFLNGSIGIREFEDIEKNYGYVYQPEVIFYPADSTELCLGARLIDGKKTTMFGQLRDKDEFYFQGKYSF